MCFFVLVGFPAKALPAARALLRTLQVQPTTSPSLAVPQDWMTVFLADEMCGCEMYSDPNRVETSFEERAAAFRTRHAKPKFRKRGWTAGKIGEAVEEMRRAEESRPRRAAFRGLRIDVRRALAELAASAASIRLVVHFFTHAIDEEAFPIEHERISIDRFLGEDAPVLPNVSYEVVP